VAVIGDINRDGYPDIATGNEGNDISSVWILLMNASAMVESSVQITSGANGFPSGILYTGDDFGRTICGLGDLDGDGALDILVGAPGRRRREHQDRSG